MIFSLLLDIKELIQTNFMLLMIMAGFLGLQVYVVHGLLLHSYLLKQNMIAVAFILPAVTMIITTTIATNFFLSLGLIGALSIVRYRTPVKNPYDLALLFGLIAIGVVTGVNQKYALGLGVFLSFSAVLLKISAKLIPNFVIKDEAQTGAFQVQIEILNSDLDHKLLENFSGSLVYKTHNQHEGGARVVYGFSFARGSDAEDLERWASENLSQYDLRIARN